MKPRCTDPSFLIFSGTKVWSEVDVIWFCGKGERRRERTRKSGEKRENEDGLEKKKRRRSITNRAREGEVNLPAAPSLRGASPRSPPLPPPKILPAESQLASCRGTIEAFAFGEDASTFDFAGGCLFMIAGH